LLAIDTNAQFFNAQSSEGEPNSEMRQERRGQNRDALAAIQNRDYNAWVEAIQDTPRAEVLLETINEGNFDRYVDMLEARRSGNEEEFEAIREELGFPSKEEIQSNNEVVKTALENADYEAWKTAVTETRRGETMLEKIDTQQKFDLLVEMHNNGERNREIAEELGLEFGKRGGPGGPGQRTQN
jgi:hypothetical protein